MTDNEIIKALECCTSDKCTCSECPYEYTKHIKNEEFEVMSNGKSYDEWSCDEWLKCDLLDLINRQKAEIERLEKEVDRLSQCVLYHDGQIADAVKEFAEKLKAIRRKMYPCYVSVDLFEGVIDNLVKEFTEDKADEDK